MQVIINNPHPIRNHNDSLVEHLTDNRINFTLTGDGSVKLTFDDMPSWKIFCRKKNVVYMHINDRNVFGISGVLYYVDSVYLSLDDANVGLMEQADMDDYILQAVQISDVSSARAASRFAEDGIRRPTYGRGGYRGGSTSRHSSRYNAVRVIGLTVEEDRFISAQMSTGEDVRIHAIEVSWGVRLHAVFRDSVTSSVWDAVAEYLNRELSVSAVSVEWGVEIDRYSFDYLCREINNLNATPNDSGVRRNESIARGESRRTAGRSMGRELTRDTVERKPEVPTGEQISAPPESITIGDDLLSPLKFRYPVTIEDADMHSFRLKDDENEVLCHYDYIHGSSKFIISIDKADHSIAAFHKLIANLAKVSDNAKSILRPNTTYKRDAVSYYLDDISPSLKEELVAKVYPHIVIDPVFSVTEEGLFVVNDLTSKPRKVTATANGDIRATVNVGTAGITARRKYVARKELLDLTDTVDDYSHTDYWAKEMHIDFLTEAARDKFITNINALGLEKE